MPKKTSQTTDRKILQRTLVNAMKMRRSALYDLRWLNPLSHFAHLPRGRSGADRIESEEHRLGHACGLIRGYGELEAFNNEPFCLRRARCKLRADLSQQEGLFGAMLIQELHTTLSSERR